MKRQIVEYNELVSVSLIYQISYLFRVGGNVRALNLIISHCRCKLSKEIRILIKKVKFTTYESLKQDNLKLKHSVFFMLLMRAHLY